MFTTLIESTPHRKWNGNAGLVSALFHSALIAAAIYATTSGAASKVIAAAGTQATTIHWLKPSAQPPSAPARPTPKPKSRPVVAPTKVPTTTPPVDPNAQPTPEFDAGPATNLAAGGAPGAFNAFEVDFEVVAIAGTVRPRYPDMLRSAGTEGQVIAQFVVNEKGRADRNTFRVVSSTHALFADAVSRALPQMRFKPASIGGKPVSQLVQQLFVFKLDR
ncbi:MAG: TonB family protein [Gemmatimonadales bacterium]